MLRRILWWAIRMNVRLALWLVIVLLVGGVAAHTEAGMVWMASTPYVALVNATTGDLDYQIQPIRVLMMSGYLLIDWIGALVGAYL